MQRKRVGLLAIGGVAALAAVLAPLVVRPRLAPTRNIESLAVLPFENQTGDSAQRHVVDAVHDAVINELAQISALTVKSRQSVLRYHGTSKPISEIARELNVDAIVDGQALSFADSVRITVHVVRARPSESQMWSERFTRNLRDIQTLQSEVARVIAERVEVAVTPNEHRHLARVRPVEPAAYQAWLRGWVASQSQSSGAAVQECISNARASTDIDSAYAPAYTLEAYCRFLLAYVTPTPPRDVFPQVKSTAERAIGLDPTLGLAHSTLGWELWVYEWDWARADRAFQRSLELAPSNGAVQWPYGFFLASQGRYDEAIDHARRAEQLSPGSPIERQNLAMVLYLARRYDEAIDQAKRTIELTPNFGYTYNRLALAYEAKAMYAEAMVAAEKASAIVGDARRRAFLARSYAMAGRKGDALRILDELSRKGRREYVPPTAMAHIYIGLGRFDEALDWLERAYVGRDADMPVLRMPAFDPLRSHPRFQRLLRQMKLPA